MNGNPHSTKYLYHVGLAQDLLEQQPAPAAVAFGVLYLSDWVTVEAAPYTVFTATPLLLALAGQLLRYLGGSFFEEVFSRSYLLRIIAEPLHGTGVDKARAVLVSAVATALVFGILHIWNPSASFLSTLNLTLLGLLFALPMLVTGRLSLSIGLHTGWNVFQNNIFGLPNSGKMSEAALMTAQDNGPALWTGGAFGPEGGLVITLTILAGLLIVTAWLRSRGHTLNIDRSLAEPPGSGM